MYVTSGAHNLVFSQQKGVPRYTDDTPMGEAKSAYTTHAARQTASSCDPVKTISRSL